MAPRCQSAPATSNPRQSRYRGRDGQATTGVHAYWHTIDTDHSTPCSPKRVEVRSSRDWRLVHRTDFVSVNHACRLTSCSIDGSLTAAFSSVHCTNPRCSSMDPAEVSHNNRSEGGFVRLKHHTRFTVDRRPIDKLLSAPWSSPLFYSYSVLIEVVLLETARV